MVALRQGRTARVHVQLPRVDALHGYRAAAAAAWPRHRHARFRGRRRRRRRQRWQGPRSWSNGKPAADGRVEQTQPNIFSADETADVGIDNQTPVAQGIGIGAETRFTGRNNKITLEVGSVK